MAIALREERQIHGAEATAERPDGTRVPFLAYPAPPRDASGAIVGAVNMLVDITAEPESQAYRWFEGGPTSPSATEDGALARALLNGAWPENCAHKSAFTALTA